MKSIGYKKSVFFTMCLLIILCLLAAIFGYIKGISSLGNFFIIIAVVGGLLNAGQYYFIKKEKNMAKKEQDDEEK